MNAKVVRAVLAFLIFFLAIRLICIYNTLTPLQLVGSILILLGGIGVLISWFFKLNGDD